MSKDVKRNFTLKISKTILMKKLILLFILVNHLSVAFTQTVKGTILDKQTKEKIAYAAIYFSGTFIGTYSDQDGNFELDVSKNSLMPLSISAVGYYSVTLNNFSGVKPLTIYLTPKIYDLNEVVIKAKSLARARRLNLELFKNQFLGQTYNAQQCKIVNENDITFNYEKDKDTLRAYASKPIQIENGALGYRITYFLDKFEYDRKDKTFFFKGDIFFNTDITTKETLKQSYDLQRRDAYMGSRMHFFRELWADNLKTTGFEVFDPSGENLNYKKIVIKKSNNKKYLTYKKNLIITYNSKVVKSYIVFLKDTVFFDGTGYFDASSISWEGQMASQRIGDLLPYEYVPENN